MATKKLVEKKKQFLLLVTELVSWASCVCLLRKEALDLRLPQLHDYP